MLIKKYKCYFEKLVLKERCPHVLSKSFCTGVYIAFSPFIFCRTIMVFLFSWIFSLNIAGVFAGSVLINNPCTMVPVYASGYFFGQFVLQNILGINALSLNPVWMKPLNKIIATYTGIKGISFWAFLLGGNLLGILLSVMIYPVVKYIIKKFAANAHRITEVHQMKPGRNVNMVKYEDNCQK